LADSSAWRVHHFYDTEVCLLQIILVADYLVKLILLNFCHHSKGIIDPIWARALVIDDGKGHRYLTLPLTQIFLFQILMAFCHENRVCFVSLDTIGADGSVGDLAFDIAAARVSDLSNHNIHSFCIVVLNRKDPGKVQIFDCCWLVFRALLFLKKIVLSVVVTHIPVLEQSLPSYFGN
jgi:hypothetical protein